MKNAHLEGSCEAIPEPCRWMQDKNGSFYAYQVVKADNAGTLYCELTYLIRTSQHSFKDDLTVDFERLVGLSKLKGLFDLSAVRDFIGFPCCPARRKVLVRL